MFMFSEPDQKAFSRAYELKPFPDFDFCHYSYLALYWDSWFVLNLIGTDMKL